MMDLKDMRDLVGQFRGLVLFASIRINLISL